jgi:hypothetical protein
MATSRAAEKRAFWNRAFRISAPVMGPICLGLVVGGICLMSLSGSLNALLCAAAFIALTPLLFLRKRPAPAIAPTPTAAFRARCRRADQDRIGGSDGHHSHR